MMVAVVRWLQDDGRGVAVPTGWAWLCLLMFWLRVECDG